MEDRLNLSHYCNGGTDFSLSVALDVSGQILVCPLTSCGRINYVLSRYCRVSGKGESENEKLIFKAFRRPCYLMMALLLAGLNSGRGAVTVARFRRFI